MATKKKSEEDIMQTFLPSTSFSQSAKWLDNKRLGRQRVECYQILKALTDPNYGWQNHPAVKMWRGYEASLIYYGWHICEEWVQRGYKDGCMDKIISFSLDFDVTKEVRPPWLTEDFASNHRAILLGKAWEAFSIADKKDCETIENINLSKNDWLKETKKSHRKLKKTIETWRWYQSHNWTETPAKRVDGKWPYLWPVNN